MNAPQLTKLLALFAILTVAVTAFATVPRTINYQGYLKDSASGIPVSGTVNVRFSLYSSPSPVNPIWSEPDKEVLVTNGIYSTRIGTTETPLKAAFDNPYYLGVTINGTDLPLQPLSSVPYAQRAAKADSVMPIGASSIQPGAVTSPALADRAVTTAKLDNGSVTAAKIADKTIIAAKIGQVCSDGDILRYDSPGDTWTCNPASGGFPALLPIVGAVTIEGITDTAISSQTMPDQYRDILLYGFDMKFKKIFDGRTYQIQLEPIRMVCDPKQFEAIINQWAASAQPSPKLMFWLPGIGGTYDHYLSFTTVTFKSQKPVTPTRMGDRTLVEYTFTPQAIEFTSPSNPAQTVNLNLSTQVMSGCSHADHLIFTNVHNLPFNLVGLVGETVYPISSYTTNIDASLSRPSFGTVQTSGPLGTEGPCFMTSLKSRIIPEVLIYTAAPESVLTGSRLLESRLKLETSLMTSYRLFTATSAIIQQDMEFSPEKIYWGFYPYDPVNKTSGPLTERGWDLETKTPLP